MLGWLLPTMSVQWRPWGKGGCAWGAARGRVDRGGLLYFTAVLNVRGPLRITGKGL